MLKSKWKTMRRLPSGSASGGREAIKPSRSPGKLSCACQLCPERAVQLSISFGSTANPDSLQEPHSHLTLS